MPKPANAHWILVVVLAVLTASAVTGALRRGDAAERRWGDTRPVAVASRRLEAGALLGSADVEVTSWPVAIAPPAALRDAPIGRRLLAAVEAGEPLTAARVSPEGITGLAAMIPKGARAVAIAVPAASLPLRVGDRVDLIVTAADGSTATIARDALVIDVAERAIGVALPATVVEQVAGAVALGAVTPVLRAPG